MTRSTPAGKQSVKLTSPQVRVSRIRRDPPPAVKEKKVRDPEKHDWWDAMVGVPTYALALFVIIFAFGIYSS